MEWSDYTKLLIEKCKKNGTPSTATFELTPFCNFNCNMCFIRLSPEQARNQGRLLTTSQWIQLAEEIKQLGTFGLEITGGEAITRDDFHILYERFKAIQTATTASIVNCLFGLFLMFFIVSTERPVFSASFSTVIFFIFIRSTVI